VRRTLPLLILALAASAQADRVITIPRGGKIPFGVVRGEYMFEPSQPGTSLSFLGFGVTTFVDAEIQTDELRGEKHFTTLNLDFNLNAPIAGIAPGISFGIFDAANVSPEGRRGYIAVSFQDSGNGAANIEMTLGGFVGRESNAFVGVSLPASDQFRFLAEHDGEKLSAGAELKTTTGSYFRLVFRGPQTLLSVGASKKF